MELQLKKKIYLFPLFLLFLFFTTSCGYRNPYVYTGPDKSIYVTSWKNRTSQLQLDSKIYQSLVKWYQKSESLKVVKDKEGADYILAGEIISIDLPSLSYGNFNTTREVKLKLRVRYIIKDLNSGKVLMEVPGETRTEEYTVTDNVATTADNENEALKIIIDELSQDIYLFTLNKLAKI